MKPVQKRQRASARCLSIYRYFYFRDNVAYFFFIYSFYPFLLTIFAFLGISLKIQLCDKIPSNIMAYLQLSCRRWVRCRRILATPWEEASSAQTENIKNAYRRPRKAELKGLPVCLTSWIGIFFKANKIKAVLSWHEQMVFKFLACLVLEKNQYEGFACLFENIY